MLNLAPLVREWETAIEAARKAKSGFTETASICETFFTGSIGASSMFGESFRNKYLAGLKSPKFAITLNKTAELVSIVAPTLNWNNPGRYVTAHEKLEIDPAFWGDPNDPNAAQMAMAWLSEYEQEQAVANTRNALLQSYLNYSPREQPGGGLKVDTQFAIIEALVAGRGVIRVDPYETPGGQTLTGGFFVSVNDFFVSPEAKRPNLSDATFIAIRHCDPHWEVEKRFGKPYGSLKGKSSGATERSATKAIDDMRSGNASRKEEINDLVVWYEVWSKCGVGTRFKNGSHISYHDAFERFVGDHAYLCFIKGDKEFLNVSDEEINNATTDQVKMLFDWPIPYYEDNRWPVALLDFWHNPKSAWPIATVAQGLGELVFLNVFVSSLADRVYQDNLVKAAIRQDLCDDAVAKLTSFSHEVLELNPATASNINELVTYLKRDSIKYDAFQMLDHISLLFDKRVGLMDLMYGLNPGGKVSRTAADANIKGEAVSVRPEYMASQVEAWHTEIANLERIAAGYSVSGEALTPLFGRMGSKLWSDLITSADPDVYMREMRTRIEANSLRKPNKAREVENMQKLSGFMLPTLQWAAGLTGDPTPLNKFIAAVGKSMEQDTSEWEIQTPPPPQPDPAEEEKAAMDAERQKQEVINKEMKNQKLAHELLEQGIGEDMAILDTVEPDPQLMFQETI